MTTQARARPGLFRFRARVWHVVLRGSSDAGCLILRKVQFWQEEYRENGGVRKTKKAGAMLSNHSSFPAGYSCIHARVERFRSAWSAVHWPLLHVAAVCLALIMMSGMVQAAPAVTMRSTNLRTGPATSYPVIARIPAGETVEIFACLRNRNWCDIEWDGWRGWAYSRHLAYTGGEYSSVPVYEIIPFIGVPYILGTPRIYPRVRRPRPPQVRPQRPPSPRPPSAHPPSTRPPTTSAPPFTTTPRREPSARPPVRVPEQPQAPGIRPFEQRSVPAPIPQQRDPFVAPRSSQPFGGQAAPVPRSVPSPFQRGGGSAAPTRRGPASR